MDIIRFFKAMFEEFILFFSKPLGFGGIFTTGNLIIWSLYLGIIAASIISIYNRIFLGRFVKVLYDRKAYDKETAIAPLETGYRNIYLKRALKKSITFKKIVVTDDTTNTDILQKKYYLSENNRERAKNLYAQNGAHPLFVIFIAILMIALIALLYKVLPDIIDMTENFFNSFKTTDNMA